MQISHPAGNMVGMARNRRCANSRDWITQLGKRSFGWNVNKNARDVVSKWQSTVTQRCNQVWRPSTPQLRLQLHVGSAKLRKNLVEKKKSILQVDCHMHIIPPGPTAWVVMEHSDSEMKPVPQRWLTAFYLLVRESASLSALLSSLSWDVCHASLQRALIVWPSSDFFLSFSPALIFLLFHTHTRAYAHGKEVGCKGGCVRGYVRKRMQVRVRKWGLQVLVLHVARPLLTIRRTVPSEPQLPHRQSDPEDRSQLLQLSCVCPKKARCIQDYFSCRHG